MGKSSEGVSYWGEEVAPYIVNWLFEFLSQPFPYERENFSEQSADKPECVFKGFLKYIQNDPAGILQKSCDCR